jgi:hypothetical protein
MFFSNYLDVLKYNIGLFLFIIILIVQCNMLKIYNKYFKYIRRREVLSSITH